ncbi:MAG: hypothetical protein C0190_04765 [Thermodesulfobacterium geofontis]|uniref:Nucleotidyl transferase AbiEii/AbiGii toxin family protein n=2 Tax=Thermodesulfobacterium geofontis TaxID=1295609 RepID=A0A2N7PN55_9BACT|nr:MAG: hypothetical protein C0190_04765 [Thermodesulfobacterium geofontis]
MQRILKILYLNKIRYLLCGGLAVNLYGIPRTTVDLDLIIDLSHENLKNFILTMKKAGLTLKQPVEDEKLLDPIFRKFLIKEKEIKVLTYINLNNPLEIVDFFIELPINFEEAFKRKKTLKIEDYEIYLVDIETLIKMKEKSKRPLDISDVENLRKIQKIKNFNEN